jgi:epoxyqueuosine reductase
MIQHLKEQAITRGERLAVLSLSRLEQVASELQTFAASEELNSFQQWIVAHKYHFSPPADLPFTPRSILLQAIPHPMYANLEVLHDGRTFHLRCLVRSNFARAEDCLNAELAGKGYHLRAEPDLPLKRLGAHSLAAYGRNNITYIDGLGSSFSYAGFFSDLPCAEDDWQTGVRLAEPCQHCQSCLKHCPTGAIRPERFLIDNQLCLSYFNEVPDPFPAWIKPEWHNSLYDCLICQEYCPMNRVYLETDPQTIRFEEAETAQILAGVPLADFNPKFQTTARHLGLDEWWEAIPKNLRVMTI